MFSGEQVHAREAVKEVRKTGDPRERSTEKVNSRGTENQMSEDREGALLRHEQPLGEYCPRRR